VDLVVADDVSYVEKQILFNIHLLLSGKKVADF